MSISISMNPGPTTPATTAARVYTAPAHVDLRVIRDRDGIREKIAGSAGESCLLRAELPVPGPSRREYSVAWRDAAYATREPILGCGLLGDRICYLDRPSRNYPAVSEAGECCVYRRAESVLAALDASDPWAALDAINVVPDVLELARERRLL